MRKIIYVHGLSSSGDSRTAKSLAGLLPEYRIIAPDLPIDPQEALNLLHRICSQENPDLVIGTSMGGMFAQLLRDYKKILINPSFHVSESMRKIIGQQKFLNKRKDGVQLYEITKELCDAYKQIEKNQFDNITIYDKASTWALFGEKDNLVNGKEEYLLYYNQYQMFDGEHRLSQADIENVLMPLIKSALLI